MAEETTHTPPANLPPPAITQYRLRLIEVTGLLYFTRRNVLQKSGSPDELAAFYKKVRRHNLLAGWWGIPFGLIFTPLALASNRKARAKLGELETSGVAGAGWYPDPTHRHGARYWDGSSWTERVSDVSTDSVQEA